MNTIWIPSKGFVVISVRVVQNYIFIIFLIFLSLGVNDFFNFFFCLEISCGISIYVHMVALGF